MQNPWDNDPVASSPQGGLDLVVPKAPSPQTPAQATGDVLGNEKTKVAIKDTAFDQEAKLRGEFQGLPVSKNFNKVIMDLGGAFNAPDNAQGDLGIIYAFAQVEDPDSVVRESEQELAQRTASIVDQLKVKYGMVTEGSRLPPEVRHQLLETARGKVRAINAVYGQQYKRYRDLAESHGANPENVTGPYAGDAFVPMESEWIKAQGGTPRHKDGTPAEPAERPNYEDIDFSGRKPDIPLNKQQQTAYDAFNRANPKATAEQLRAFGQSIGVTIDNAESIIEARDKGAGVQPGATAIHGLTAEEKAEVDQRVGEVGTFGAFTAGVADTATFGTSNKIIAAGRDLIGKGEYDRELVKANAVTDRLSDERTAAYLGGQVFGGLAMPMGSARTPVQLGKVAAAYGGAYGLGSSDSLEEVPGNVALGTVAGGALGYGIPKGIDLARAARTAYGTPKDIPPLVDPVTGKLNEPLEAAGPAARVGMAKAYDIDLPMGAAGDRTAAILEKGLDVMPGSAGVTNDARRIVEGQVENAVEGVASKFGASKTLSEGGGELQKGAKQWISRFERVSGKAYDRIPISDGVPASLANTKSVLNDLTSAFDSNPELAKAMKSSTIEKYANALGGKGSLSWRDLKAFRSRIGEAIGERRFSDDSSTGELRKLYGALSEDMKATAEAIGPNAAKAFERANNLYREGQTRIDDALVRILGDDVKTSPNKAASALQAMTKGGKSTGDLKTLLDIKASTVKSGAWDEVAGTLVRMGGQPANSPGRSFDPKVFVQWYADMAEPARAALFKPEARKALDEFVQVSQRLAGNNALRNTSQSAPGITAAGTVGTIGAAIMNPLLGVKLAAVGAANYGMAKAWTSPKFVRWATGYSRAVEKGDPSVIRSRINGLKEIAATNPAIREEVVQLQQKLLEAVNDNLAAKASAGDDEEGRQ